VVAAIGRVYVEKKAMRLILGALDRCP